MVFSQGDTQSNNPLANATAAPKYLITLYRITTNNKVMKLQLQWQLAQRLRLLIIAFATS